MLGVRLGIKDGSQKIKLPHLFMTGGQSRSETLKSTDRMNFKPHEPLYCMYLILAWYIQEEIYFWYKLMKQMKTNLSIKLKNIWQRMMKFYNIKCFYCLREWSLMMICWLASSDAQGWYWNSTLLILVDAQTKRYRIIMYRYLIQKIYF